MSFSYAVGKETARTGVTHRKTASDPRAQCDVFIDQPLLIVPLVGVTFGENFYRTVLQTRIAARAIEVEHGIPLGGYQVLFHDPQRANIVQKLQFVGQQTSSGDICIDPVRGNYSKAEYAVALKSDPGRNFTYRPQDMKQQCDALLPRMPFQQQLGEHVEQFNNEVFDYLQMLDLGTVTSTHVYGNQSICSEHAFLVQPSYLMQWQSGQQEILHSPGMMDVVSAVQQQAGVIKSAEDPGAVRNGSWRSAIVGTTGRKAAPMYFALRAARPTITLAARGCFPVLKPGQAGVCCNCKRVLLNEVALFQRLREHFEPLGFTVQHVEMSTLTAREAVRLMGATTLLISVHSSVRVKGRVAVALVAYVCVVVSLSGGFLLTGTVERNVSSCECGSDRVVSAQLLRSNVPKLHSHDGQVLLEASPSTTDPQRPQRTLYCRYRLGDATGWPGS